MVLDTMDTMVEERRAQILSAFEDAGYRITEPRRRMALAISGQPGAFDAETINSAAQTLGRATIFRTLKLLLNAGVLCKSRLLDGSPKYSFDYDHHHHHLVCESCGSIEEFRNPGVERVLRAVSREMEGELLGHRLEIFRRCPECVASERFPKRL
jgi:Fur family ferric uptake transcriptional regulator